MSTITTSTTQIITPRCFNCHEAGTVEITSEQAAHLDSGAPVQEVLPDMGREEREQIISGIHPHCWNELFG